MLEGVKPLTVPIPSSLLFSFLKISTNKVYEFKGKNFQS